MKSTTLFSYLLAAGSVQAAVLPFNAPNLPDGNYLKKRQGALAGPTHLLGLGGKVADPLGAASRRVELPHDNPVPGVRRVKMRYGPYKVVNMNRKGLTGEAGSLWNYPDTDVKKPCTECTIVGQQAGLEYPDGKIANVDTGLWLHHMVHFTIGPGRWDPTCYGWPSLPHVDVGSSAMSSERYFSSGNERTPLEVGKAAGAAGTKFGYHLKKTDKYAFIVDLMNMNMEDKVVYMTMTYDFIDGPLPAGWRDIKPVWFDANQCMTSEVSAPKQDGSYTIKSSTWKPNFEGEVLGVGGHLHDGGVNLEVITDGQTQCDSRAGYAEKKEYIFPNTKMAPGVGEKHISSMSVCYLDSIKTRQLSKSQTWYIKGNYDYDKHEGMKEGKSQSSVMAIAIMYVAVKPGT